MTDDYMKNNSDIKLKKPKQKKNIKYIEQLDVKWVFEITVNIL